MTPAEAALLVHVQLLYLMHPHCRVREGFLDALVKNIKAMARPDDEETELLALVIVAFKKPLAERCRLCRLALDRWADSAEAILMAVQEGEAP